MGPSRHRIPVFFVKIILDLLNPLCLPLFTDKVVPYTYVLYFHTTLQPPVPFVRHRSFVRGGSFLRASREAHFLLRFSSCGSVFGAGLERALHYTIDKLEGVVILSSA